MPAPNEYAWYKWFPAKALTSLRWASLTVTEEGVYRRMYDLASLAQPSSRRGYFYEHDKPSDLKDVAKFLRIDARTAQKCVKKFAKMQLMEQDQNGAWGFPNFAKHQRDSHLRVRSDGLGSGEVGTNLAQNRRKIGAIDAEAEAEAEIPCSPLTISAELERLEFAVTGGHVPDVLAELVRLHGESEVRLALLKTQESGKRKISYVKGILKSRAKEGYPSEDVQCPNEHRPIVTG